MARKTATLVNKLLDKRGIKDIKTLSPEEQDTYDRWRLVLTGDSVTPETLKTFCKAQISIIESKCDGTTPLTMLQQACIHVYTNILKAIEAPEAERESLERYLTQLVNA